MSPVSEAAPSRSKRQPRLPEAGQQAKRFGKMPAEGIRPPPSGDEGGGGCEYANGVTTAAEKAHA